MKLYWLNGAINIQGESESELKALAEVYEGLQKLTIAPRQPNAGANKANTKAVTPG